MFLDHSFITWVAKNFLQNGFSLSHTFVPTEMFYFLDGKAENEDTVPAFSAILQ